MSDLVFIRTKIQPPLVSLNMIARPSHIARLNSGLAQQLTLISAPAGFGKTTLAAAWLAQLTRPAVWLSLDERDNDLVLFVFYLATAVAETHPHACRETLALLGAPQDSAPSSLTAAFINDIAALPEPLVLMLDDLHLIHDDDIVHFIEQLIEFQPRLLHLVLISRSDPLLPLPRLRANQRLNELRAADLRFDNGEAAQLLSEAATTAVAPQTAALVNERTEGWVAGLRLVALSLVNRGDAPDIAEGLPGASRKFVTEYLFTEVLARLPQDIQQFLLQTALLERFNASLCDAVTGDTTAVTMLETLRRANAFLLPSGAGEGWYRYHQLFREMLLYRQGQMAAEATVRDLHGRACDWYAVRGYVDDALDHAIAAHRIEQAIELVEAHSQNLLNGVVRHTHARRLRMLPEEAIWQRPQLMVASAWLAYRQWRLRAVDGVLDHLEAHLADEDQRNGAARVARGHLFALRSATRFHLRRDYDGCITDARQAVAHLPESERGALGTAVGHHALALAMQGQTDAALQRLLPILTQPSPAGPAPLQAYLAMSHVLLHAGRMAELDPLVARFMAAVSGDAAALVAAEWIAGLVAYERHQFDVAQDHFLRVVDDHSLTNFAAVASSLFGLARMAQVNGRLADARRQLQTYQAMARRLKCSQFDRPFAALQAEQWALDGEVDRALQWARLATAVAPTDSPLLFRQPLMAIATILLRHGAQPDWARLEPALVDALTTAEASGAIRAQVQLLGLLADCRARLGQSDGGLLETAVALGESHGLVMSLNGVGDANGRGRPSPNALDLTRREAQILGMMAAGLSNKEIAAELVISLYTVKRHASNLYRKLGVDGRRQAVNLAIQHGLLPSI